MPVILADNMVKDKNIYHSQTSEVFGNLRGFVKTRGILFYAPALFFFLLFLFTNIQTSYAQLTQITFGKNVLQHKDFFWSSYRTDNFDIYFYPGGKELARYIVTEGDKYVKQIENMLDYPMSDRITIVLYNSYTDYRQSNFRIENDDDNSGGKTPIVANTIFIYFDGSHFDFAGQIKTGVTRILLHDMLYGGNLTERLQNTVLLNLPDWYIEGLVEFVGNDWDEQHETRLRNGIVSGRFKNFKKLSDADSYLIGQSMWRYVYEQYGPSVLSDIIYITRTNRSIDAGFQFVLNKHFSEILKDWYDFESKKYNNINPINTANAEELKLKKIFKKGIVTQWDISPDGKYAAVVTNDIGKERVWVVNLETGKKKKVFKSGYRRVDMVYDYNYPLIGWQPHTDKLAVFYTKQAYPAYIIYDAETKKRIDKVEINTMERILSFDYADNGYTMVVSGIRNGQTDIYLYNLRSQVFKAVTNDIYDDLNPHFVNNSTGIVFSSNRPDNSLKSVNSNSAYDFNGNYEIYYLPNFAVNKILKRLSNSPADATFPNEFNSRYFTYLTDENGSLNLNAAHLDTVFQYIRAIAKFRDTIGHKNDTFYFHENNKKAVVLPENIMHGRSLREVDTLLVFKDSVTTYGATDYSESISSYRIKPQARALYESYYENNKFHILKKPIPDSFALVNIHREKAYSFARKSFISSNKPEEKKPGQDEIINTNKSKIKADTTSKNLVNYFQPDYPLSNIAEAKKNNITTGPDSTSNQNLASVLFKNSGNKNTVKFASASLYEVNFAPDFVYPLQIGNTFTQSPYVPYVPNSNSPTTYSPDPNGAFKIGLSDLFKDYRIVGGVQLLSTGQGATYFLSYSDLKNRLDKTYTFFRQGETFDDGTGNFYRTTSEEGKIDFSWPFSEISAIKFSGFSRFDKTTYLSSDYENLNKADQPAVWAGGEADYIFDNTIKRGMNLYNGTRAKVYTQLFNELNGEKSLFYIIGGDFRTYTKVSRQIIWANRFAMASSFGQAKVVYFLGGVDNAFVPGYNTAEPVSQSQNYVYQAQATNMRGFDENVRNGSSFAVFNSELRIPVFKYLLNHPIKQQFWENFQAVGFTDIGTAWTGFSPFSGTNTESIRTISNSPLTITVISPRNPIVYGYGFGLRSSLFSYFIRLDFAWGVDNGTTGPQKIYLSLGLDF